MLFNGSNNKKKLFCYVLKVFVNFIVRWNPKKRSVD